MGHELGHLLSLQHLKRSDFPANLMSSQGTVGKRPMFAISDSQVNQTRQYGLSRGYLR